MALLKNFSIWQPGCSLLGIFALWPGVSETVKRVLLENMERFAIEPRPLKLADAGGATDGHFAKAWQQVVELEQRYSLWGHPVSFDCSATSRARHG